MRLAKDLQVKNLWGKKTAEQTAKTERGPSREIKIASAKFPLKIARHSPPLNISMANPSP